MNTLEGNKLIAQFMGVNKELSSYYLPQHGKYVSKYGNIDFEECFNDEELQYHTSWDWLIPVVEKIESLGYSVNISCAMVYINGNDGRIVNPINIGFNITKLESTYKAILEFIQWYNNQNK